MKLHPSAVAALLLLAGGASASSSVHKAHPRSGEIEAELDGAVELDEPNTISGATNDSLSGSVVGIDSEAGVITPSTLRRNLQENPLDLFKPLTCNSGIESVTCVSWSTLTITPGQPVVIPCGQCINVDVADGTELDLADGLDIQGKLVFPDNKKVTVRTTHVYLQGVLKIRDNNVISPENESVKFHFYGTTPKSFVPHADNSIGCPSGSCDAGVKPFLIAGGKLDVEAWSDPACPTWTRIQDLVFDDFAALTPGTDFALPAAAPNGCARAITDADFEDITTSHGWRSQMGVIDEVVTDASNTCLKVHNRTHWWQGPYLDLSDRKLCIMSGQDYTFSARIRLSREDGSGTPTACSSTGTQCPELVVRWREDDNDVKGPVSKVYLMQEDGLKTTDGEWFDLYGKFDFSTTEANPSNVYVTLTIEGPEEGVIIEMDDLYVGLPPEDQYHDAANVADICNELFIADSGADGYFGGSAPARYPYPLYQNHNYGRFLRVLSETDAETGGTNNFYRITNRVQEYESIATPLPDGCVRGGARYDVSFRARFHHPGDFESVRVQFVAGSKSKSSRPCVNTFGGDRGWVECSVTVVLNDDVSDPANGSPYFRINSGFETGNTIDQTFSIDYDDISIKLNHPSIKALVVEEEVANCWGAGSEVTVTSVHNDWDGDYSGRNVVSATKLNDGSGMAHLSLDKFIARPTSVVDNPYQATEVALLKRNVVFYSEEEVNNQGAYMSVMTTTGVPQVLSGVHIDQFGQWGVADRYSLQFDRCDNVEGTVVSKNLIDRANYDGLVLQGTHNVTLSQNVAYNSRGSSFKLRDGKEWDNLINFNMAIRNQNPFNKDYSGFWIRSVRNRFVGNVAAGAVDRGFYLHLQNSINAASQSLPGGNPSPRSENGIEFRDNVAHACNGYGMVISTWRAEFSVPIQGFRTYRNEGHGVYAYGRYIKFDGAYIADSRVKGLDFHHCENCKISDSDIVGATALAVDAVYAEGEEWHQCLHAPDDDLRFIGVEMEVYRDNSKRWYPGVRFEDVRFSGFNDTKCSRPATITFDSGSGRLPHFDLLATMSAGTRNLDGGDFLVDFCRAETWDYQDVVFHDIGSGLHPDGPGSYSGDSALVSDYDYMKGFAEGQCKSIDGRCAAYCEGLCLRFHTFTVTAFETEDVTLKVRDLATNKTIEIGGNFLHARVDDSSSPYDNFPNIYDNTYYYVHRIFSVPLPDSTFEAQFMKDGQPYWPTFVERGNPEPAPACWRGGGDENTPLATVTFLEPPAVCTELVKNGDGEMEGGNYTHWYHASGGVTAVAGAGVDGSTAIASGVPAGTVLPSGVQLDAKARDAFDDGLSFYVDTRCMKTEVGKEYELSAMMKLEDATGTPWSCDPDLTNKDQNACPRFTVNVKTWNDASKSYSNSYWYKIATVVRPYNDSGYTLVHGTFVIPPDFAAADSVRFIFQKTSNTAKMYLDNVSIHPLQAAARNSEGSVNGELVINGDFEEVTPSTTKYWIKRTNYDGAIEVVPGAEGSATAVKVTGRTSSNQGPGQFLNPKTFSAGQEYQVSTKFRLSNSGTPFTCDMNLGLYQALTCPQVTIQTCVGTIASHTCYYPHVATVADPGSASTDHWGVVAGKFFPDDDSMFDAFKIFAYLEYPGIGVDVEVDDFTITPYTLDCGNVVKNGDFEEGTFFGWDDVGGSTTLSMASSGAGGTANALKISSRTDRSHGAEQMLEAACLGSNDQYLLQARFKLESGGAPFSCDHNVIDGENGCPIASIVSVQDDEGTRDRAVAAAVGAADANGWHDIRGIFELYESDMASDRVYLRFEHAPVNIDMIIDEVVMTKIENPIV